MLSVSVEWLSVRSIDSLNLSIVSSKRITTPANSVSGLENVGLATCHWSKEHFSVVPKKWVEITEKLSTVPINTKVHSHSPCT